MLCIAGEVRESKIAEAGQGLFTLEFLPKGKIVIFYVGSVYDRIIDRKIYLEKYAHHPNSQHWDAFVRLVGRYYVGNFEPPEPEDYVNHSDTPNLVYHCGIFITAREIKIGEELTVDYRYFVNENQSEKFKVNGEPLFGLSDKEALLRSARELIAILEDVEDLS